MGSMDPRPFESRLRASCSNLSSWPSPLMSYLEEQAESLRCIRSFLVPWWSGKGSLLSLLLMVSSEAAAAAAVKEELTTAGEKWTERLVLPGLGGVDDSSPLDVARIMGLRGALSSRVTGVDTTCGSSTVATAAFNFN